MQEENSWFDKSNVRIFALFILAFSFIYLDSINQKYFKRTKSLINDAVSQASYVVTWPIRELLASPGYIRSIINLKKENERITVGPQPYFSNGKQFTVENLLTTL